MKAFIGLLIIMGVVKLPRLILYWQTSNPLISVSGITDVMTRTRFQQIFRFLHLADSSQQIPRGEPGYDKLYKVRKMLDILTGKFKSNYTPSDYVTIDEAMIPFKGRLGFKQYMKDKPTKWGIKVFTLSDATNGYVYRLQIYTGKNIDNTSDIGLCSRVCLDLMSGLPCGFKLFTDNYYTSPRLYSALYNLGYNCCGTARTNRKDFPTKDLIIAKNTKVNRGYIYYRTNGPILAVAWHDRRHIYFISTMHRAELTSGQETVKRKNPDGSRIDVTCPPLLPDYQQYMRGVDRGDQLIGYYNVGRRSTKWWKRCFSHLIECSLLNAHILDSLTVHAQSKRDFLSFRLDVAKGLIGTFSSRKAAGRRSGESTELERLNPQLGHWPTTSKRKLNCVVCSTKRAKLHLSRSELRHETRIKCSRCNVHLCIEEERQCYTKYHTHIQYWQ